MLSEYFCIGSTHVTSPCQSGNCTESIRYADQNFGTSVDELKQLNCKFHITETTRTQFDLAVHFICWNVVGDALAQVFTSSPSGGGDSMQLMYLLSITAAEHTIDLAAAYFNLRQLDIELDVLARSIALQRRSLELAHKSLRRYLKEADAVAGSDVDAVDPAVLRAARAQLHQGVGALEMIGLPGPARVLRASEAVVQRFIAKPKAVNRAAVEAIESTSFGVLDYLSRKLAGKGLPTLALFPLFPARGGSGSRRGCWATLRAVEATTAMRPIARSTSSDR